MTEQEREALIASLDEVRLVIGRVMTPEKLRASDDRKRRLAFALAQADVRAAEAQARLRGE